MRAVAIGERVTIDLGIRKRLEPPVEDRQIGFAGRGLEPYERLPKGPADLPDSLVTGDGTATHVDGSVQDDVRKQRRAVGTLGGSPGVAQRPRQSSRETVHRCIGSIEAEIAAPESVRGELHEYVGDVVQRTKNVGIAGRVGVSPPRARQIFADVVGIKRPEETLEQAFRRQMVRFYHVMDREIASRNAVASARVHSKMFTKDVRFEGWTTEDWSRLLGLWKSTPRTATEPTGGGLLIVHSGGRVRKMLHTKRGRIEKDGLSWPSPLPPLAARHGASWIVAAPTGGLEKLAERFGTRCQREDDLATQARLLFDIVRELSADGIIEIWPYHIDRFSLPARPPFENTFAALFPPGHLFGMAVFHEGELWTSLAIKREKGGISRIVGPDELRRRLSFLSGDFRRDYRYTLEAMEDVLGPVAVGCFTELSILRELQSERSWGAWLRAFAVRDVIITPARASLAGPLAADAAAWASIAVDSLGHRWGSLGLLLSLWRRWR